VNMSGSVVCDSQPPQKKPVRGILKASGYLVKKHKTKANDDGSQVTLIAQCDPQGILPKWIVNIDAVNAPLVIGRIRKLIEKGIKTYNRNK